MSVSLTGHQITCIKLECEKYSFDNIPDPSAIYHMSSATINGRRSSSVNEKVAVLCIGIIVKIGF